MNKNIFARGCGLLIGTWLAVVPPAAPAAATPHPASGPAAAAQRIGALAIPFVPNAGQWDARAAFAAQTFAGTLFVTRAGELVHDLAGMPAAGADATAPSRGGVAPAPRRVLVETLVDATGARPLPLAPRGTDPRASRSSYFIGDDPGRHAQGLESYEQVSLGEPWPGIAARLRAHGHNVEKIFTVAPGGDPGAIRIALGGASRIEVGAQGDLIAWTANGPVSFSPPFAYQDDDSTVPDAPPLRREVPVRYALAAAGTAYGFAVGSYDRSRPLVVDPLLQATYFGGTGTDAVTAMVVHPLTGEVLIAGTTTSGDLPCTSGGGANCSHAAFPTPPTNLAAHVTSYVARIAPDLQTLRQTTYLGGTGSDFIAAMTVNPASGEVLVAGQTTSTDFPCVSTATSGCQDAPQTAKKTGGIQGYDGFVARFSADLAQLRQATYLGGTADDSLAAIAVHPGNGTVYVAGITASGDLPCTTATPGSGCQDGAQKLLVGTQGDAFVARLEANLTGLTQVTYFGGTGRETLGALAIHPVSGEVLLAGSTSSTDLLCTTTAIPGCATAAQSTPAPGGSTDAFIVRFLPELTKLLQVTYLGGNSTDGIAGMAVHPVSGEVYVAGNTQSTNFPCVSDATSGCTDSMQTAHATDGSQGDGFVARLNPALTRLLQSAYYGGNGSDTVRALSIHPLTGEVFIAGDTLSSDLPCVSSATANCLTAAQTAYGGPSLQPDAFVARFSAALTRVLQATYFGGATGLDVVRGLGFDPASGDVFIAGETGSTDLPCTTSPACNNGAQPAKAPGSDDAYVARFAADLTQADNTPAAAAFTPQLSVTTGSTRTSNILHIAGMTAPAALYLDGQPGSSYCISNTNSCLCATFGTLPTTITAGQFVCVRHNAAAVTNQITRTDLHVGGSVLPFLVATGPLLGGGCSLDIDGNGTKDPLTDGLLLLRAMLGATGSAVTTGATAPNATRNTWALIQPWLNGTCGGNFAP